MAPPAAPRRAAVISGPLDDVAEAAPPTELLRPEAAGTFGPPHGGSTMQASLAESFMKRCSWQQAGLNLFFNMFAASQVPFAISQMGWVWGGVIFFLITVCSWWSGYVLVECCVRSHAFTWRDLGHEAFGPVGAVALECLQTASFILTGIVQTQGAGSSWQQAFPNVPLCSSQWVLLNSLPYLFFLQIPSFSGSGILRFATFLTIILTLWRVALYLALLLIWGRYHYTCYGGQTPTSILSAAANLIFTFGVKNILPEMTREMTEPADMHKSWTAANMVAMPVYTAVGFWGMYAFGIFNQGANFFLNFKDNAATSAYLIFSATTGYLPIVYGQICLFLKVELALGVLPTDWWSISNPATNRLPCVPPVLFRLCFRLCVVAFYVVVAEALLGVGLQNMVSLVGALAVSAFSFYMPWVLYWRMFATEMTVLRKLAYSWWTAFGLFLAATGVYYSVQAMRDMDSAGLFQAPCRINAFFLGEFAAAGSGEHHQQGGYSSATGPGSFHDTFYQQACLDHDITCSQYGACCEMQGDVVSCNVGTDRSAQPEWGNGTTSYWI